MNIAFAIPAKMKATDGYIGVPVNIPATATSSGDFMLEQSVGPIGFVQSVYIDNSGNASPLSLTFGGTGQIITVKGHTQGYYPVIPFNGTFSWAAASAGGVIVPVIFMNVKFEAAQWATQ